MLRNAQQWLSARKEYATAIVRIGLALVLLWFGVDELRNPEYWTGFIPPWIAPYLPVDAQTFILFNGILEIVVGVFLLVGYYTRVAAMIAGLHLLSIIIAVGYNDIAVRDLGLAAMALSLLFSGGGKFSVDERK